MKFTNQEGFDVICLIQDTTTFALNAEEFIKDLTPSGDPLHISITDTDEDKYTPIRAKRATIKILSDIDINVSLFALNSTDNRWLVDIYIDNPSNPLFLGEHHFIFTGFLVLNDLNEPLLDSAGNEIITLTASDGLGLLKVVPLTKPDGTNPRGKFTIIQFVSWCLQKTGLKIPINVMNNLMEESFIGLPAYNNIKLWAKTFEDEIGTCINCYDVLKYILGEECFLVQWKDQWWIKRIDEIEDHLNYYDNYDYQGVYTGTSNNINFSKNIGLDQGIELIAPATMVFFDRPYSFIQETIQLEYPKEIIDNIDFSRGNTFVPLAPPAGEQWYHIDDWTTQGGTPLVPDATPGYAYIKRVFVDNYEKERYIVLVDPVGSGFYLISNPIYIHLSDKFDISLDFKFPNEFAGISAGQTTVSIKPLLFGDDGNIYVFGRFPPNDYDNWNLYTEGSGGPSDAINLGFTFTNDNVDETKWQTISSNMKDGAPASGLLFFYIPSWAEIHFNNFQFTYKPYINGSYQKYTAQHNKVFKSTLDLKAKRDIQIYMSDIPKQLIKGALYKTIAGKDILAGRWVNGAIPALRIGPIDPQFLHPIGFIQAFSVWNQFVREMRRLDFQASGLNTGTDIPDLMHNYTYSDYSPHTTGKKFLLIHFDMDLYQCKWKGHMQEVFDFQRPKVYNDHFEFKFIENR